LVERFTVERFVIVLVPLPVNVSAVPARFESERFPTVDVEAPVMVRYGRVRPPLESPPTMVEVPPPVIASVLPIKLFAKKEDAFALPSVDVPEFATRREPTIASACPGVDVPIPTNPFGDIRKSDDVAPPVVVVATSKRMD
jgi:hypothetical protein